VKVKGFCSIDEVMMQDVCIPNESDSDTKMTQNIDLLCTAGGLDCSPIEEGGAHYQPNTPFDHATWAYDAFYQQRKGGTSSSACIGQIEVIDIRPAGFDSVIGTTQSSSVLRISPELFEETCGSVDGGTEVQKQVFVGIFGYQLSTVKTLAEMEVAEIEAVAASASLLLSGQPQSSSVAFQRGQLYKFIVGSARDDIDISVIVSSGNVDVFVSTPGY